VANAVDASVAAAAANPNGTVALQSSSTAAHYYVAVSPSPQAFRRRLGANALAWMLGVAALWPFVVALALVPFEMAAILCSRKMIMLDLWLLALLDKRVDSGRALIELLCPSPEDKYRAAEPHDRGTQGAQLAESLLLERVSCPRLDCLVLPWPPADLVCCVPSCLLFCLVAFLRIDSGCCRLGQRARDGATTRSAVWL
jgi:hypothetical protein